MIFLEIIAPFASFKNAYSREYAESYLVPPPSTVYGCLLSLVGEMDRDFHRGVKIAIALPSPPDLKPKKVKVLRTVRRLKKMPLSLPQNSRPDFQEIVCGLRIIVGVDSGEDVNNLEGRIERAIASPETIERFGGLSLGESRDLIDDIRLLEGPPEALDWLIVDPKGSLKLPYWVDYLGSKDTKFQKFVFGEFCQEAFCKIL